MTSRGIMQRYPVRGHDGGGRAPATQPVMALKWQWLSPPSFRPRAEIQWCGGGCGILRGGSCVTPTQQAILSPPTCHSEPPNLSFRAAPACHSEPPRLSFRAAPACHSAPQARNLRNPTTSTPSHKGTHPSPRRHGWIPHSAPLRSELLMALQRPRMLMKIAYFHGNDGGGLAPATQPVMALKWQWLSPPSFRPRAEIQWCGGCGILRGGSCVTPTQQAILSPPTCHSEPPPHVIPSRRRGI